MLKLSHRNHDALKVNIYRNFFCTFFYDTILAIFFLLPENISVLNKYLTLAHTFKHSQLKLGLVTNGEQFNA